MKIFTSLCLLMLLLGMNSCKNSRPVTLTQTVPTAAEILGNPSYQAISFGGFRHKSRAIEPTQAELKEDLLILHAMGVRLLRTYNVEFKEVSNLLAVIEQLKDEDPAFEMYLMMGIWIDCKDARTANPIHQEESPNNAAEVARAIALAQQYPDVVKIIAVGNEAMVKWAASYYVEPGIILKWVNHLQNLKKQGELPADLWITSSDNFASWGGGGSEYHVEDLTRLMEAVDFVSMHTYPMHDTHYNPAFWGIAQNEAELSDVQKIEKAMLRARNYAIGQYESVVKFMKSKGIDKPVHIGETGWTSTATDLYGDAGSKAVDEYKAGLYYKYMREWSNENEVTCFYFEAFDEPWKDGNNPQGSENHFGLIDLQGNAKFAIWNLVDDNTFIGLTRGGYSIKKSYNGDLEALLRDVKMPPPLPSN